MEENRVENTEEATEEGEKKLSLKLLWILLGVVFGLLIVAYVLTAYYFSSRFAFNTTIDNINCSRMTVAEVEAALANKAENLDVFITGRDAYRVVVNAKDVGLTYKSDGQVKKILQEQNALLWFMPLVHSASKTTATTTPSVDYDTVKFNDKMKKLDLYNEKRMRAPVDAYPVFQDTQYGVHPEDMGSTLAEGRAENAIKETLLLLENNLDLDKASCYLPPVVFSNNPDLLDKIDMWNQEACFAVYYVIGENREVLDASTTLDWIEVGGDGTKTLNAEKVKAWVRELGLKYDTVGTTRNFVTVKGEKAVVEGGAWGWEIDEKAEIEAILFAFKNKTGLTREPYYVQEAVVYPAPGEPDWGTTYIELDLTDQHMYYVVEGVVVFDTDVVTGAPWGNRPTPQGVYSILNKMSPAKLVGERLPNGKPSYETWVTFWMPMTYMGHGFHDANWQPWFGGDRYTYAGSHGCINMYYGDAEELYSLIEIGTPVISHY